MKKNKRILAAIIVILFYGCAISKEQKQLTHPNHPNFDDSKLREWRKDSLGCLGFRNIDMADYICDTLNFKGCNTSFVIEKLGQPNKIFIDKKRQIFTYYVDMSCRDNVFIDSIDYCWIKIEFISDVFSQSRGATCY